MAVKLVIEMVVMSAGLTDTRWVDLMVDVMAGSTVDLTAALKAAAKVESMVLKLE